MQEPEIDEEPSRRGTPVRRGEAESARPRPARPKPTMGLIGVGAFGAFCLPHLRRHFRIHAHDTRADLPAIAERQGALPASLATAAAQDIVVLAVPLAHLAETAQRIASHLRPGTLVLDVCSLKTKPLGLLEMLLPPEVDIVGTHPLFGPQSGRDGIAGLRIAVCPGRGGRARLVARFLERAFGLEVMCATAAEHDRQMAYVQGLTHLIARIVVAMDLPPLDHATGTFEHLVRMVDTVRFDSDELFRTIVRENPFSAEMRRRFTEATHAILDPLAESEADLPDAA